MNRPWFSRVLLMAVLFVEAMPSYLGQIADYGAGQLARQAVGIRAPYLAEMARITYSKKRGTAGSGGPRRGTSGRRVVQTTFTRSRIGWFKPWAMANEISKKVQWDEHAPLGTGFAREEAQRQALTKLFTSCLDYYEQKTKAEALPTNDVAITFSHCIALGTELGAGRRITKLEEASLAKRIRDEFAGSPYYWTDADKQAIHETIVITTMLAQVGYDNATHNRDQHSQATFREVARQNVTALTNASLEELRNARSTLGSN